MDDEEEFDGETDEEWEAPTYPWSWRRFGVYVGYLAANVFESAAVFSKGVANDLAAANNHEVRQRKFATEVALEIESLTEPNKE